MTKTIELKTEPQDWPSDSRCYDLKKEFYVSDVLLEQRENLKTYDSG